MGVKYYEQSTLRSSSAFHKDGVNPSSAVGKWSRESSFSWDLNRCNHKDTHKPLKAISDLMVVVVALKNFLGRKLHLFCVLRCATTLEWGDQRRHWDLKVLVSQYRVVVFW